MLTKIEVFTVKVCSHWMLANANTMIQTSYFQVTDLPTMYSFNNVDVGLET